MCNYAFIRTRVIPDEFRLACAVRGDKCVANSEDETRCCKFCQSPMGVNRTGSSGSRAPAHHSAPRKPGAEGSEHPVRLDSADGCKSSWFAHLGGQANPEPVSKPLKDGVHAGQVNEALKQRRVVLPAGDQSAKVMQPTERALHFISPFVAPQRATIVGRRFGAVCSACRRTACCRRSVGIRGL